MDQTRTAKIKMVTFEYGTENYILNNLTKKKIFVCSTKIWCFTTLWLKQEYVYNFILFSISLLCGACRILLRNLKTDIDLVHINDAQRLNCLFIFEAFK